MCGRYSLAYQKTDREYDAYFKSIMQAVKKAEPRFQIAPTQTAPIIRMRDDEMVCEEVRWGLFESWWPDKLDINRPLWNARAEKVFKSVCFKNSARKRRCLVLASGWFEWKPVPGRKTGDPYTFGMKDKSIMMLAGLWTTETVEKDVYRDNFTIITTDGNALAKPIHNRMPIVLNNSQAKAWLDPHYRDLDKLQSFLVPYKGRDLMTYQVGPAVNKVKNIGPECLEPAEA